MMMSIRMLVLLPAVAMSAAVNQAKNADRHVRVAHEGAPVSVAIEPDGRVMKVPEEAPARSSEKVVNAVVKAHSAGNADGKIPKIIHLMAYGSTPKDLKVDSPEWQNPIWPTAVTAWKKHFPEPEYTYQMWTTEKMDKFFKDHCSQHYNLYASYKQVIMKDDLFRYCVLAEMGGIYSDLDYEPRQNFYDDLQPGKISLLQSPYSEERFQNALMASPKGAEFTQYWKGYFEELAKETSGAEGAWKARRLNADHLTGPKLMDRYRANEDADLIHKLPCKDFQRKIHTDQLPMVPGCGFLTKDNIDEVKGIHWGTWSWVRPHEKPGQVRNGETMNLFSQVHPQLGAVKSHQAALQANLKEVENMVPNELPDGVVLLEMAATESEESWKSAFFFFASLVLMVILAGMVISGLWYNKQQGEKAGGLSEKMGLSTDGSTLNPHLNDSSSTSDSGEKIAMLFDRVRKSLEDLNDKAPEQADVAGVGTGTTNTL